MNVITYDVYKNTVKKHDGFNPVNSENNYSQLVFRFKKGDDWEKCSIVTASFWISIDEIVKSEAAIVSDKLTATFNIPSEFAGKRGCVKVGLQSSYRDESGNDVTIATNIIVVNLNTGAIVKEYASQNIYEQLLSLLNDISGRKADKTYVDSELAKKITDGVGTVKTNNLADKSVTSVKIADGAVTVGKIGVNAVLPENIVAGAISKEKLTASFQKEINGKADKDTTLSGYGITDAYTKAEIDSRLNTTEKSANKVNSSDDITDEVVNYPSISYLKEYYYDFTEIQNLLETKSDKATTLSGYGIKDAYTKEEANIYYNSKLDKRPFDAAPSINSPCYLTSGAVYTALLGKADKSTTLSGYGITDAYTKTEVDSKINDIPGGNIDGVEKTANKVSDTTNVTDESVNYPSISYLKNYYYDFSETDDLLNGKVDKATTLEGYGITDAYTKVAIDKLLNNKLNKMPFDDVPALNSPCYLTSGAVYTALLGKADKSTTLSGYGITDAYTKSEVDNAIANKNFPIVEPTETTVDLQPNKFYKFGEVTELNITLAEITDNTQLNEFMFEFISGGTATTLTLPDTIKWADTPSIEANKIYQCSIVNNIGLIVGVDNV